MLSGSHINPEWTQIPWSWVGTTYSLLNHMQGSIREGGWGKIFQVAKELIELSIDVERMLTNEYWIPRLQVKVITLTS